MKVRFRVRFGHAAMAVLLGAVAPLGGGSAVRAQSLEELVVMAIEIGQEDLVEKALERGANPNGTVGEYSLLAHAIDRSGFGAVTVLVRKQADINRATGPAGRQVYPLSLALQPRFVQAGRLDMALGLMRLGADPKINQAEPARVAIDHAQVSLFQAVLAAGGSPTDEIPGGKTVFQYLVEKSASALEKALKSCDRADIARHRFLAEMVGIAVVESTDLGRMSGSRPMLGFALGHGLFDLADAAMAKGGSTTEPDPDGRRPVKIAYDYRLPEPEGCSFASASDAAARAELRERTAEARDKAVGRLLRAMLQP